MAEIENKVTDYVRQVIVVRKDLHMPTGKAMAMAGHLAMTFITDKLKFVEGDGEDALLEGWFSEAETLWLTQLEPGSDDQLSFAKIVCGVDTETELQYIFEQAVAHGLEVHKLIDSGYSHNKPNTFVGIAIGPDFPDNLKPVTGELQLYR